MSKILAGHIQRDEKGKIIQVQSLEEHSRTVAMICAAGCRSAGLENLGYLTGLLHDMGKSATAVQEHLYGDTTEKINHASAGMRWLWENCGGTEGDFRHCTAQLAGLAIGCHHGERLDIFSLDGSEPWRQRMYSEQAAALYTENCRIFFEQCIPEKEVKERFGKAVAEVSRLCRCLLVAEKEFSAEANVRRNDYLMRLGLVQRFLFAVLVDADWTDSANWFRPDRNSCAEQAPRWDVMAAAVESNLTQLKQERPIDTLRSEISNQCAAAGRCAENGIYRLYVPTGGGKTFAGLRYCLQAAKHRRAKRVFYFAPFRSIIGQNTAEFKKVLGDETLLLEHHSDVIPDAKDEELMCRMERWQGVPIVSTTMVQFLNTLFAAPRQNVRRMVGLADSILLFDEIQSLPLCHTYLFNTALNFLTAQLGCTAVLCTATQPELERVEYPLRYAEPMDIVPDFALRFEQFRRTKIVPMQPDGGFTAEALADFVQEKQTDNRSILVILNTRAAVEKVFSALQQNDPADTTLYCLTTHLCVQHRQNVIETIRNRLSSKTDMGRIICVSTQLIEAGVDLSFDCVVRSMAGLPSVAQAAGRCNRHGETACRNVYLVEVEDKLENLDYLPDVREGRLATRRLLRCLPPDTDLLSPESIRAYYHLFYAEESQKERMGDLVNIEGRTRKIFELLAENPDAMLAHTEATGRPQPGMKQLRQAFGTAERNFRALEDSTMPVLVPYGTEGQEIIGKLMAAKIVTADLLHKAERFAVGVTVGEHRALENAGALLPAAGGMVTVLRDNFYDMDKGVQTTAAPLQFLGY